MSLRILKDHLQVLVLVCLVLVLGGLVLVLVGPVLEKSLLLSLFRILAAVFSCAVRRVTYIGLLCSVSVL